MRKLSVTLTPGRQLASGTGNSCRYPGGSIRLQQETFRKAGLDISHCHPGTLNMQAADQRVLFPDSPSLALVAEWFPGKTETFLIAPVKIHFNGQAHDGFIYQPSLIRDVGPKPAPRSVEILAPKIEGIQYGAKAELEYDETKISLITGEQAIDNMRVIQGDVGARMNLSQETAVVRLLEMANLKYSIALQFPDAAPLLKGVGMPNVDGKQVTPDTLAVDVARLTIQDKTAPSGSKALAQSFLEAVKVIEAERLPVAPAAKLPAVPTPVEAALAGVQVGR